MRVLCFLICWLRVGSLLSNFNPTSILWIINDIEKYSQNLFIHFVKRLKTLNYIFFKNKNLTFLRMHLISTSLKLFKIQWKYCTIGPKCRVLKKRDHRKRNTQTRNLREKNSYRFLFTFTTIVGARKVRFVMFFLSLLLGGDGVCRR